ncbi:uncharacterized protein RJT20DRAFT_134619 [Scheffersomyces xylosifermentans]|uniref:uncharacterized protein n=1 Tax=Scheffersomyces xylosifermentans TaxID=1304137 RepID=UPI00315DF3B9
MGYPANFKVTTRKLSDNVVIASSAFTRADKFNFGARMALFNHDDSVIVWSALPYGKEVEKSLELLTGSDQKPNITHLIIPDREHTLAAKSFKEEYPNLKIIAMDSVKIPGVDIDYTFSEKDGNKLIDRKALEEEIGIKEPAILDNFEFVYLPFHGNQELVTYEKSSKIVFEADLLFNLGVPGTTSGKVTLEQYSPELGFKKGFNPHSGWSFPTRYMQPNSKVGSFLFNKLVNPKKSKNGLQAIYNWDFNTIVMCHGNLIDKDARATFKHVFSGAF